MRSNIAAWLKRETPEKRRALEIASRHFDRNDEMDVHTLEAVYAKESSFGQIRGKRNSVGAAGDFQIRRATARGLGLQVSAANDERFDVGAAAAAAAKQLKRSDDYFRNQSKFTKAISVSNSDERKKFALAAYNAGDSRIARAQQLARKAGDDPTKWESVKKYLEKAGATKSQAKETRDYVDSISNNEKAFDEKSNADASSKYKRTKPIDPYPHGAHWITKDGRHILIRD